MDGCIRILVDDDTPRVEGSVKVIDNPLRSITRIHNQNEEDETKMFVVSGQNNNLFV